MKTFKTLIVLLACAGQLRTMNQAGPAATTDAVMTAPLVKHDVHIITLADAGKTQKVAFTPEQIEQLSFLRGMLEEMAPKERKDDIDFTELCIRFSCLRYEVLQHIPHLVGFQNQASFNIYLAGLTPDNACLAARALHFLNAPQNIIIWAHLYCINRLVNNHDFATSCLALPELRQYLELIMHFCRTELPETAQILETAANISINFADHEFRYNILSPDGSIIASCNRDTIQLLRSIDGALIGPIIEGNRPTFSQDSSRMIVRQSENSFALFSTNEARQICPTIQGTDFTLSPNGRLIAVTDNHAHTTLLHTSDGSQVCPTISGSFPEFSPDSSLVAIEDMLYVTIYRTRHGRQIGHKVFGRRPKFSPNSSLVAVQQDDTHFALYRLSDGKKIGPIIIGLNIEFSPDGSKIAVKNYFSTALLYRISNGKRIGNTIVGSWQSFSPDGSLLACEQEYFQPMLTGVDPENTPMFEDEVPKRIVLYRTSDCSQVDHTIDGERPFFSEDGSLISVHLDDAHVALYRVSDGSQVGPVLEGRAVWTLNQDNSLAMVESDDPSHINLPSLFHSLYRVYQGNFLPIVQNIFALQIDHANGVVAYQQNGQTKIIHILPAHMSSREYLLALAATHLGHDIREEDWAEIFVDAPERLKALVRAKTGRFSS